MHIKDLDLNLLRLFEAVYQEGNVSRAAERLGLSQPTVSQGLARLRLALGDPLFERVAGGVRPSMRAERLADAVRSALATLDQALTANEAFSPANSDRVFRLHLSDIGEARFLPALTMALRQQGPGLRLESRALAHGEIASALDRGSLDLAIGFLPSVTSTRQQHLLQDRYVVLVRHDHAMLRESGKPAKGQVGKRSLASLEFACVRSHADTLRILQLLGLDAKVSLTVSHFLSLPDVIQASDLAALVPRQIAQAMAARGEFAYLELAYPLPDFTVSLHWSARFETDPALVWLRTLACDLFGHR